MGYEIKVMLGKPSSHTFPEWKRSSTPYADGSGFEPERDENGKPVETGRVMNYFTKYAEVDMCKLGGQDDSLNRLIQHSFSLAKQHPDKVYYFYGRDGNSEVTEDRYGARMHPVPLKDLVRALNDLPDLEYRRLRWLKALVDSMSDDTEEMFAMFYGY